MDGGKLLGYRNLDQPMEKRWGGGQRGGSDGGKKVIFPIINTWKKGGT